MGILLLIFVFDPLAVLLLIAANQSLRDARLVKVKNEDIADFTRVDAHAVQVPETVDAKRLKRASQKLKRFVPSLRKQKERMRQSRSKKL